MSDIIVNNELEQPRDIDVSVVPEIPDTVETPDTVKTPAAVQESPIITEMLKAILETPNNEVVAKITKLTFQQILEKLFTENKKINVSSEMQNYLLVLCKEHPDFFGDVEDSLKKIVVDNKVDAKDIPEIILLVSKVYELIKTRKVIDNVDPYELIKLILHSLFLAYFEFNQINNDELENIILHIIDVSINLIKLQAFKLPKKGCLSRLFKR